MSFTTIAVAGPDRSGVGPGVPVPRRTIFVGAVARVDGCCAAVVDGATTANAATMILDEPGTSPSLCDRGGPVNLNPVTSRDDVGLVKTSASFSPHLVEASYGAISP